MSTQDNRRAPVLFLLHSSLQRFGDSAFKSRCPVCDDGVLTVTRNADLVIVPDDVCISCGQKVNYLDVAVSGQPVARVAERPKRKKDWVGRRVRLRRDLENKGGNLFRAGEVMEVRRNFGGLELRTLAECTSCFKGHWRTIKDISEADVELLPRSFSRMSESRDPSLILVAVRKVLIEGLVYHEHDGHSMPKKVVRDALTVIGIPEEDQP